MCFLCVYVCISNATKSTLENSDLTEHERYWLKKIKTR